MHRTMGIFSLLAILAMTSPASVQEVDQPHRLIRPPRSIPSHITPPAAVEIIRSRLVEIDLGPMGRSRGSKDVKAPMRARLHLDLFESAQHTVTLRWVTGGGLRGDVFEGDVDGDDGGSVVLAVTDGQMFGNVKSGGRWYQIRYAGDGIHAIVEIDEGALGASLEPVAPAAAPDAIEADQVAADDGSFIDVLVMYTPNAKTAAGGDAGITNLINTAIAETNTAYQRSGVTQRLRLVHTAQTADWLENGVPTNADSYGMSAALDMLRLSDGRMDEAHTLRDTYGADAISLIVNGTNPCGIAYIMQSVGNGFASWAFSVVARTCATGNYSFGHELGHNMGLAHDRANAGQPGAYSYAYGWQAPSAGFRTILAYNCTTGCTRIQNFSNPNVTYNGVPTGSPLGTSTEAHNALALNNTALTFSNFRASVTPACTYTLTPPTASFPLGGGSGAVTVTAAAGCTWSATSNSAFLTVTGGATGTGNGTVSYSVAANSGAIRSGTITIGGQTFTVNQSGIVPTGLVAEAISTTQIRLTWNTVAGAAGYEVDRWSPASGDFVPRSQPLGSPWVDTADPDTAYRYRVRASTPAGWTESSTPELATTVMFTDASLSSTVIKAVHLTELRTAVDAVRDLAGLGGGAYTELSPAGMTAKANHITELRTALDEALGLLGLSSGGYTGGVTTGGTIQAVHFQEIRDRVK